MNSEKYIRRVVGAFGCLALTILFGAVITSAQTTNTFPNTGNAGVGTTSPPDMLSLRTTTNGATANISIDAWTNGERGLLIRSNTGSSYYTRWKVGSPATTGGEPGGNVGTDFGIERFNDGGSSQGYPFFIRRGSGNVGIGTNQPGDILHVNNAVRISPYTAGTSGSYINAGAVLRLLNGNIYQSGGSEISSIQFGGMYSPSGTQTDAFYNYVDWSAGWLRIRNNQQTKIQIGAGDEWGRQDIYFNPSGGKVGIGTTSPLSPLHVKIATNDTFAINGHANLGDGVQIISVDESGNTAKGMEFVGSSYYFRTGYVGIGTATPGSPLEILTTDTTGRKLRLASSNRGIDFFVLGSNNNPTIQSVGVGTALELQAGNANNGNYLFTSSGNVGIATPGQPTEKLEVNGNIKLTGSGNITASGTIDAGNIKARYQDVAEWVPASEQLSAGTVVVLDSTKSNQVTSSSTSYDTRVAGVVSEQPGIALGEKSEGKVLVATTGRVRVKVDATRGPIHIGDLLVTSDIPGVAMKSEPVNLGGVQFHRPGTLIGKALESLEKGKGAILVLLSLQ
jgi:hypothetical protein